MALIPDKTLTIKVGNKTLKVSQKIVPDTLTATKYIASYVPKGGKLKPCAKLGGNGRARGITIHNTDAITVKNTSMAEQYTRATYNENMGGVMVSYYVSGYDEIWQMLNTDYGKAEAGWHASDGSTRRAGHRGATYKTLGGNLDTIAIECIGNSAEAEDATARLAAYLCKVHKLTPNVDVYTHNYWMGQGDKMKVGARKNCPIYILPHWSEFVNNVQKYYEDLTNTPSKPSSGGKLYRVQVGAFSSKANAEKLAKELKAKGYSTIIKVE